MAFLFMSTENSEMYKNQTTTEHFIDKRRINKNFTLIASYYIAIYSMRKRKGFANSLQGSI